MPRSRSPHPFSVVTALTVVAMASGCWPCCVGTLSTTSTASLVESESRLYAEQLDGGDVGSPFRNVLVEDVGTTVNVPNPDEPHSCIAVGNQSTPLTILFDCPSGGGSFSLQDLNATACDGVACAALGGTLDVHSFAAQCPNQDCGHLEADLSLPAAPSDGGGPSVSGTASLYYDHSSQAQICELNLGGGD